MFTPTLPDIYRACETLAGIAIGTPVLPLASERWRGLLPEGAEVRVKLELFQQSGSFKARGAYLGIKDLSPEQRRAGVIAASGGNHALAVAWAAQAAGVQATICMPETVDPLRIEGCRALGAQIVLTSDMARAFAEMEQGAAAGKALMHPFEAPHMILGSATCGAEFLRDWPEAEVYVLPVGGGGLIAGMSCAIKLLNPSARVIGVEPTGADSMTRSRQAGSPVILDRIATIADSLGAPKALPLTFALAQAHVDEMVLISDDEMRAAMRLYLQNLQLMVEPACAAALAAVRGPLAADLAGQRVAIIACGSNISFDRFAALTSG